MEYKFRHEQHDLQDKALKPDYKEDLAAVSREKAHPKNVRDFKAILAYKERLTDCYYMGHFLISDRRLALSWTIGEYASTNGLNPSDAAARKLFEVHLSAAQKDFYAIQDAIRKGEVDWIYD